MDSNCRFRSETNSRINAARKAIGDSGEEQKLIRTIARRGFRFIGAVRTQSNGDGPADAVVSPRDELRAQSRPAVPLSDRPAIAVLPFVNMSGDPEEEYFSDGITEDIVIALSKLRWVLRDRAQLLVHLQRYCRPYEAGRRRARRRLCGQGSVR